MQPIEYSIVIPVFNADNALEKLHDCLTAFFRDKPQGYEIIYVDDCSSDKSWEVLKQLKKTSSVETTIVRLSKNFGQHAATVCGFKYAKGNFIITMDDDLEVHPSEIMKLQSAQKNSDNDLVYGVYPKLNVSFLRSILTRTFKLLSKIDGENNGKGSSFRILKQSLAKKLVQNHKQFTFIDELCLWYTKKISSINVDSNPGYIEKKRYSIGGLLKMSSTLIMFSSTFPLKLVTNLGLFLSLVNFLIGLNYLIKKIFFGTPVEGYTSLIVSILFSTGLIIFCIGIIAQYLSKVMKALNNAPSYNEDEVIC
jgi:polyisoprenyl-phosphate glycosyltransferase